MSLALLVAVALGGVSLCLAAGPKPPKNPAQISISVAPDAVAPGGEAQVTLELRPTEGVKINRYPKIKLTVPAAEGLVGEAEISIGNDAPPKPDEQKSNYFAKPEPLTLALTLEPDATSGRHEIAGKLVYFYCMPASGFCAPHRTPVTIPVVVR